MFTQYRSRGPRGIRTACELGKNITGPYRRDSCSRFRTISASVYNMAVQAGVVVAVSQFST